MDNNKAKKMVNNKLKLYRNDRIGETAMGLGVLGFAVGTTILYGNIITGVNINNYIKLLSILGVTTISSGVSSVVFAKNVYYDKNETVKVLKELKKELKQGNNRFADTEEENFDIEFANIVKQRTKNKVI